ncbi:MAG: hypothetical protein ACK56Z_06725, partial [Pseudanabaena sp.]
GETLHYIVTLDQCYIFVCPDICDVGQPWWIFAAETGELLLLFTASLKGTPEEPFRKRGQMGIKSKK